MVKGQHFVTSHCTSQKELCLFVFVFQFVIVGFDIFVSTAVHIVELSTTGNVRSWLWSIGQLTKSRWGFVVSEGNYTALHTHSTLPHRPSPRLGDNFNVGTDLRAAAEPNPNAWHSFLEKIVLLTAVSCNVFSPFIFCSILSNILPEFVQGFLPESYTYLPRYLGRCPSIHLGSELCTT